MHFEGGNAGVASGGAVAPAPEPPRALNPRRVVVDVAPAPFESFVSDRDGDSDEDVELPEGRGRAFLRSRTLRYVAERLGLTRQRVQQIEHVALEKIRIGFELEARLGVRKAVLVLAALRGAPLREFEAALHETKD